MRSLRFQNAKLKTKKKTMLNEQNRMLLIKVAYWLGIGADALWAVGLLFPQIFGILIGRPDFNPDLQIEPVQ